jgi:hypothetical protein|tara:strand:- start:321 stop:581 length:261 start_codon:yes stop_codon:yes gene_type:complete
MIISNGKRSSVHTPQEDKIKNYLIEKGFNEESIYFYNNSYGKSLRYGYWEHIDQSVLEGISENLNIKIEVDIIGSRYSYHFEDTEM